MAIKKPSGTKPRTYGSPAAGKDEDATSIAATFRQEGEPKRPTQKTTMEFDVEVYRALKLHAVGQGKPMRDLLDSYVRAGLEGDGIHI